MGYRKKQLPSIQAGGTVSLLVRYGVERFNRSFDQCAAWEVDCKELNTQREAVWRYRARTISKHLDPSLSAIIQSIYLIVLRWAANKGHQIPDEVVLGDVPQYHALSFAVEYLYACFHQWDHDNIRGRRESNAGQYVRMCKKILNPLRSTQNMSMKDHCIQLRQQRKCFCME